ncbi:MAG: hypothetical protein C0623_08925 [Desulfuromonas sp.]|nr:MAG: hypothetical protein C0623_08925 [Desulfuromonas sp.]
MFEDFFVRALLGGVLIAIVAAPFGVFVVWRRLAYFGDTLAHSALLGVALGYLLHINLNFGVILVCLLVACMLYLFQQQKTLAVDTVLGILSHSSLSLGLVVLALFETVRIDLMGYLFGDILAIGKSDLIWIVICGGIALVLLFVIWKPLLLISIHEDLARVEGVRVDLVKLAYVCLLAVLVAVMMKIVGLVLVTSLFIIPAATARKLSRTPEMMALLAVLFGSVGVVAGLFGSYLLDTPAGPSIVLAATGLFVLVFIVPGNEQA